MNCASEAREVFRGPVILLINYIYCRYESNFPLDPAIVITNRYFSQCMEKCHNFFSSDIINCEFLSVVEAGIYYNNLRAISWSVLTHKIFNLWSMRKCALTPLSALPVVIKIHAVSDLHLFHFKLKKIYFKLEYIGQFQIEKVNSKWKKINFILKKFNFK